MHEKTVPTLKAGVSVTGTFLPFSGVAKCHMENFVSIELPMLLSGTSANGITVAMKKLNPSWICAIECSFNQDISW
jgi:hypothetical protein